MQGSASSGIALYPRRRHQGQPAERRRHAMYAAKNRKRQVVTNMASGLARANLSRRALASAPTTPPALSRPVKACEFQVLYRRKGKGRGRPASSQFLAG